MDRLTFCYPPPLLSDNRLPTVLIPLHTHVHTAALSGRRFFNAKLLRTQLEPPTLQIFPRLGRRSSRLLSIDLSSPPSTVKFPNSRIEQRSCISPTGRTNPTANVIFFILYEDRTEFVRSATRFEQRKREQRLVI